MASDNQLLTPRGNAAKEIKDSEMGEVAAASPSSSKPSAPPSSTANVWKRPPPSEVEYHFAINDILADGVTVDVDEDDVSANLVKLENALIGKMLGKAITFYQLKSDLMRKWGKFGEFKLKLMENNCFMCVFDSPMAVDAILTGGPWVSFGSIIGVIKWSHDFSASSYTAFSSPLWVRFPNLPLAFWSDKNITRIVTMLGSPLWLDGHIHDWERSNYARVCVRMDLSQKLPAGVWIRSRSGRYFQRVEYEGIEYLCYKCGVVGHTIVNCPSPSGGFAPQPATATVPLDLPSKLVDPRGAPFAAFSSSVAPDRAPSPPASFPPSPINLEPPDAMVQDNPPSSGSTEADAAAYEPWTLVS